MRILGAMLGGTISSYDSMGTVKLGEPSFARSFLLEKYPSHEFIFPGFTTYSSENATPYLYRDALKKIANEAQGFDGILITHGTDTCAFFAQLAARVLGALDIPFVITGSMKPPDKDPDEASGNLAHAVRCLEEGRSGVVFRNKEGIEQLYSAHLIMSPDINGIYSEYKEGTIPEKRDYTEFLNKEKLPKILVIPAFPGRVIPEDGFDRVLICCNHSGTAFAGLSLLVEEWTGRGIECFMAPVPVNGGVYESRKILREAGAIELTGMPVEGAWSEVLIR